MELFEPTERKIVTQRLISRQPWSDYNEIRGKSNITIKEITDRITDVASLDQEVGAFFAILYLTGSRIKEILRYKYKGLYWKLIPPVIKPGLKLKNIEEIKEEDGNTWVYFTTRNEKQNSKKGDKLISKNGIDLEERYKILLKDNIKTVKLLFEKECPDYPLLKLASMYITELNLKSDEDEIFGNLKYKKVFKFCKKIIKVNPHALRHLRMEHLRIIYHMDIADLKEFGGWKNFDMPLRYSKSNIQQIGSRFAAIYEQWKKEHDKFV
jgi:integrase